MYKLSKRSREGGTDRDSEREKGALIAEGRENGKKVFRAAPAWVCQVFNETISGPFPDPYMQGTVQYKMSLKIITSRALKSLLKSLRFTAEIGKLLNFMFLPFDKEIIVL